MSYKLALHVLVSFTVQVVPIHKHITIAVLYSEFSRYQEQNSHKNSETNGKGSGEVI